MVQSAPHKDRVKLTTEAAKRENVINVIQLFKNIIKLTIKKKNQKNTLTKIPPKKPKQTKHHPNKKKTKQKKPHKS